MPKNMKEAAIRVRSSVAIPMVDVAVVLGVKLGLVGPLALVSVARRAMRYWAKRQFGITLSVTDDFSTTKRCEEDLRKSAKNAKAGKLWKIWAEHPHDWTPHLESIVERCGEEVTNQTQIWKMAIRAYCAHMNDVWAADAVSRVEAPCEPAEAVSA